MSRHSKWLALHIGGQRISVYVVSRKHPQLQGCDGIYWPESGRIYIAKDLGDGAREDALVHELDHAVNFISGGFNALRSVTGKKAEDLEENLVRCRTPIWHRLLQDLGLKFPAFSKGLYE